MVTSGVGGGGVAYLLLCAVSALVGGGVLRLLRLSVPPAVRLVLAPAVGLMFWTVCLGVAVGMRAPVRFVVVPLWGASLLLALYGAWGWRPAPREGDAHIGARALAGISLTCLLAPVAVMHAYFRHGLGVYFGSLMPDGWSYVAVARYLWQMPRGTADGLSPLYQYGSIFANQRYISYSLLDFLSPLGRIGDPQSVGALYQAWLLCALGGAVAAFWLVWHSEIWPAVAGVALTVVSGWIADMIWLNNFDNELALVFMPAIVAILLLCAPQVRGWWPLLGGMLAAVAYAYAELSPVILLCVAVVGAPILWGRRAQWRAIVRGMAGATTLALALVSPFLSDMVTYIRYQFSQTSSGEKRAGEGFLEGLARIPSHPSAFWGLGTEQSVVAHLPLRNAAGAALTLLTAVGVILLMRRPRDRGIAAAIALLVAGAAFYIVHERYSYGAFKLIGVAWWLLVAALLTALLRLAAVLRRPTAGWMGALAVAAVLVPPINTIYDPASSWNWVANNANNALEITQYRRVLDAERVIAGEPTMILVENFLASEWAVYYLRNEPVRLGAPRQYASFGWAVPAMRRAQAIPDDQIKYVLTDGGFNGSDLSWSLAWSGGPYRLWRPPGPDWTLVTGVLGANHRDSRYTVTVTPDGAEVRLWSGRSGDVFLSGNVQAAAQPNGVYPVLVTTDRAPDDLPLTAVLRPGAAALRVPVRAGEMHILLHTSAGDAPVFDVGDLRVTYDRGQSPPLWGEVEQAIDSATAAVTFGARPAGATEPLITMGRPGAGDVVYVRYLDDDQVVFGLDHWGTPPIEGAPVRVRSERPYEVRMTWADNAGLAEVLLDGAQVMRAVVDVYPVTASQVETGENPIGGTVVGSHFSGTAAPVRFTPLDVSSVAVDIAIDGDASSKPEPLVAMGRVGAGDIVYVRKSGGGAVFGLDHWGRPRIEGAPVQLTRGHVHRLQVERAVGVLRVTLDGVEVLRAALSPFHASTAQITVGENWIGGSVVAPRFSGTATLIRVE